jgi:protein gp37
VLDADRPRVFVMSLGDFAEDHPDAEAIRPRAWEQIRRSHWLDFLILTKRPDRYPAILPPDWGDGYHNVWLGTSIENDRFTGRADALRAVPAAVWFLSLEPLLGPLPSLDLAGIDWIIVGGESGAGFRPMEPAWALDVLARAAAAGVARFYKQGRRVLPASRRDDRRPRDP